MQYDKRIGQYIWINDAKVVWIYVRRLCAWLIVLHMREYHKEWWYTGMANGLLLLRNLYIMRKRMYYRYVTAEPGLLFQRIINYVSYGTEIYSHGNMHNINTVPEKPTANATRFFCLYFWHNAVRPRGIYCSFRHFCVVGGNLLTISYVR